MMVASLALPATWHPVSCFHPPDSHHSHCGDHVGEPRAESSAIGGAPIQALTSVLSFP